ncbi:MAG: thioredoxin domain-containing protein [Pseudomonadota bacterium]
MKLLNMTLCLAVGAALGYFASTLRATKLMDNAQCYKNDAKVPKNPVFSFQGKTFYLSDLPLPDQVDLLKKSQSSYDQSVRSIEQTALRMVLAKEKGMDLSDNRIPTFQEIFGAEWVPESKVKEFYEQNKKSFPAASTLESMAPQIRVHLAETEIQSLADSKLGSIKNSGALVNLLPAPCGPRVEVQVENQPVIPSKVKTNSTLTLLSDFSCIQCRQSYLSLLSHLDKMSENVNIVHMAYSETEGDLGFDLAKGSICASKQGAEKTSAWIKASYLVAMKIAPNGPDNKSILNEVVTDSGVDRTAFESCFMAPEAAEIIKKNNSLAKFNHIAQQMAIFLNKRLVIASSADQIVDLTKASR